MPIYSGKNKEFKQKPQAIKLNCLEYSQKKRNNKLKWRMCGCVELGICTFLYEVLIMELIFPIISLIMWLGGTFLAL